MQLCAIKQSPIYTEITHVVLKVKNNKMGHGTDPISWIFMFKIEVEFTFLMKNSNIRFLVFSSSSYFYLSFPEQVPRIFCKMMTSVSDLPNLRSFETLYIAHIWLFLAVFERQFSKLLLSSADGCESLQCKSVRDGVNQLISIHSLCERCPNCKQGKMSITTNSPTNKIVPSTDIYLS